MSGENYAYTRQNLDIETWDYDQEKMVVREPTNAEILQLLDALHADITGGRTAEYEQHLSDRYWSS